VCNLLNIVYTCLERCKWASDSGSLVTELGTVADENYFQTVSFDLNNFTDNNIEQEQRELLKEADCNQTAMDLTPLTCAGISHNLLM
jgi:hypothetical protein